MYRFSIVGYAITIQFFIITVSFYPQLAIGQNDREIEDTKTMKKLNVVSSVAPITDIVKNIGQERINLVGLVPSNKEGTRMIGQGAVRIEDDPFTDAQGTIEINDLDGKVIQVGKRRWAIIKLVD